MFSGFYDALNKGAAVVLPEAPNPTPRPSTPTPRSSLGPDSGNPSPSAVNGTEAGYSTYQRRTKPSLEDRLRASLAAKENRRVSQERGASTIPEIPQAPNPSSSVVSPVDIQEPTPTTIQDPANLPLPNSPPTLHSESSIIHRSLSPTLEGPTNVQAKDPPATSMSIPPIPDVALAQPKALQETETPATKQLDPLSPAPASLTDNGSVEHVQELTLPSAAIDSKFNDPLTPALMELEREQQAAIAKARMARSPPPPSSPPKSHHPQQSRHKSNASKSMVPDGEPFLRLGGHPSIESMMPTVNGISYESLGIDGISSADGLRAWVVEMRQKAEASQEEIKRLNAKVMQQDSRIEELRDTHRLESLSQSDLIESLRQKQTSLESQISDLETDVATERSLLAAERSTREPLMAAERAKHNTGLADITTFKDKIKELTVENEKLQGIAKEEEEKRTKAISLLKTVRTKLVKAEKDRDDFQNELNSLKENGMAEERKGSEEVRSLRHEVERANNELNRVREEALREVERIKEEARREVERRRNQLEGEIAAMQEAVEREMLARRGEWEIEGMAAKTAHQKEVAALNTRISALNTSLAQLMGEKEQLFSDMQARQSDLEAARTELEDVKAQMTDLDYQLRQKEGQLGMMQVEIAETRRTAMSPTGRTGKANTAPSNADVARLLAEAESRSEARVAELRFRLKNIEVERAEQEESWSRTLAARGEEIERLRGLLNLKETEGKQAGDYKARRDKDVEELEERIRVMETEKMEETRRHKHILGELEVLKEGWETRGYEIGELNGRVESLNNQLEDVRAKEAQLKANNKTLRDELRKVQSSAALLERQRNPGFGYWASPNPRAQNAGFVYGETAGASSSNVDLSRSASNGRPSTPVSAGTPKQSVEGASSTGSARSSTEVTTSAPAEDDVNLEYLRNVIFQFLENEKMRPNLVRVISVILKFTPQETRKLMSKV